MKIYTLDQAREHLGELCNDAQQGEVVLLDRGGDKFLLQPAAGLFPSDDIDWEDADFESSMLAAVTGVHHPLGADELSTRGKTILERIRHGNAP
jgi:hypothetical protein